MFYVNAFIGLGFDFHKLAEDNLIAEQQKFGIRIIPKFGG